MIELIRHNDKDFFNQDHSLKMNRKTAPYEVLEGRIYTVLQRYSNIHRGAGHFSRVTTALYEQARAVVLEYFRLSGREYTVVFGSKWGLDMCKRNLEKIDVARQIFSNDIGLPLGVGALAVRRSARYKKPVFPSGGGTARLVSRNAVIWGAIPAVGEAGTPNIVGVIALALALKMLRSVGDERVFRDKAVSRSVESLLYVDDYQGVTGSELMSRLRGTLMGGGLPVPTGDGWLVHTCLDHAASTPTFEPVWNVVRTTLGLENSNLMKIADEVKAICGRFFNAPREQYDVLFTQNTTEGINVVAELLRRTALRSRGSRPVVLNTLLEHNSNELPWRAITGVSHLRLDVEDGFLDLGSLEEILEEYNQRHSHGRKRIELIAVAGCSNVLGSLNDIEGIVELAHRFGARVLVDAAQLAAHRPVDMAKSGIDYLVFSGHKMYAPFGSGGLIVRRGLFDGNGELLDDIVDSGNANVAGIAAMGKAMDLLGRIGLDVISDTEVRLMERAVEGLRRISDVRVFGRSGKATVAASSMGPVAAFSLGKVHHNLVAKMLAERGGISVRSGCLCAHLLVKRLMGVSILQRFLSKISMFLFPAMTEEFLPGIVRVSLGMLNTDEDIDHFLRTLEAIVREPQPLIGMIFARLHYGNPALPKTDEEEMIDRFVIDAVERVYSIDTMHKTFVASEVTQ
jgi:selenocysteine lyase/cysteine desulfurase